MNAYPFTAGAHPLRRPWVVGTGLVLLAIILLANAWIRSTVLRRPSTNITTFPSGSTSKRVPPPRAWIIGVVGRDYQWNFRYPGLDGVLGTADDVWVERTAHLPRDADVEFRITSDDYVYVFSAPQLALRKIAVPELTYSLRFRTNRLGVFELPTDPMCGVRLFHSGPMGQMVVESATDFQAWWATHDRRRDAP